MSGASRSRPLRAAARLASFLAAITPLASTCSCGGPSAAVSAAESAAGSPVEVHSGQDYPSLSLVAREGDPFGAIGIAAAHDLGAVASVWLGALVEERARGLAHPFEVRPSGNGLVVRARVDDEKQATRAVEVAFAALSRPVAQQELARVDARVRASLPLRVFANAAERAAGECVGELAAARPPRPASLADLEKWRAAIFSSEAVAVAVVGRRQMLDAAASALRDGPPWPNNDGPADPLPPADVTSAYGVDGNTRTLSVALRVANAARAVEAAKLLGDRRAALATHAAALDPAWAVDRVVATTRPRGACLRVDLAVPAGTPLPLRASAEVGALALDEMERALAAAGDSPFSLDRAVLEAWDPREAAAIAAWRALSNRKEADAQRVIVSYAHPAADTEQDASFAGLVAQANAERRTSSLELRRSSEPGQGEYWLLIGTPCATASETTSSAGISALAMRSLAQKAEGRDVRVEAWVSAEGVGLLAHAPRESVNEPPLRQALRVAAALGRALAGTQIGPLDVAPARAKMQTELDPETEPFWPVALEALSPKHPSLLDPRGTWQSITDLSTQSVETERRAIVRGPLRLAALGADAAARTGDAALELERWLRPERARASRCAPTTSIVARPGEYEVDAADGAAGSHAVVGVTLPLSPSGSAPVEAELTAFLLNRPGGYLDRAVRAPGLAAHAEATVLGGGDAAALAIEVATPGPTARAAATQVRALLSRLADGTATAEDLATAKASYDESHAAARIDPRLRIVETWLGRAPAKLPDLATLRAFHRQVFAPERHVVVLTRARP
ncbi:MAG TPA: hypothetical protein VHC69_13770 [Polyangiaceae bacterium]|nr:hypothetical protein [Polyangiaceae bacterium]